MKNQSYVHGTSLIKVLLLVFRGLFLLYCVGLIFYLIIAALSLTTRNQTHHTDLPVMFRFTKAGNLVSSKDEKTSEFNLYNATGVIRTESLSTGIRILTISVSVLISICILLIIKLICQMLEAAQTGNFLVTKNAIRMRHMALLFIFVFFIDKLSLLISSSFLTDKLDFPGVHFMSVNYYSFARWEYVFFYLFLLVVAEAFRIGAQLKQENDLTI